MTQYTFESYPQTDRSFKFITYGILKHLWSMNFMKKGPNTTVRALGEDEISV